MSRKITNEELSAKASKDELLMYYSSHKFFDTCAYFEMTYNQMNRLFQYYNISKRTHEEAFELHKSTCEQKYGNSTFTNRRKAEQTMLEKFGVKYAGQSAELLEKQQNTCLQKYGVKTPMENKEIAYKNSSLKNYDEVWQKAKQTVLDKYGVLNCMQNPLVRKKQSLSAKKSSIEIRTEQFLISNNIDFEHHYVLKNAIVCHEFDFAIFEDKQLNMLLDCDGVYYHSYLSDVDGKKVNNYSDDYRSSLVPDGVKFMTILEGNEDKCFSEILQTLNLSYDNYLDSIFTWCRQYEFPYPNTSEEICRKSYQSLVKSDMTKFSMRARYGDKIISKYHKSLWKAHLKNKISIYDAWQDDTLLKSCIKNRVIYKGNDLDPSKVLAGFNYSKIAPKVSIFNANLAKYLIWKYLNEFDTVFDPFSGFSGRLLGATSLNKKYIGNDINSTVTKESQQIIDDLALNAQLTNLNTEELKGNYPCLFTCPPYADKEQWFGTEVSKYSCDDWIDICLNNFDCKKYLFVVDDTLKYKQFIVEILENKSHFGSNTEYVILINK